MILKIISNQPKIRFAQRPPEPLKFFPKGKLSKLTPLPGSAFNYHAPERPVLERAGRELKNGLFHSAKGAFKEFQIDEYVSERLKSVIRVSVRVEIRKFK